MLSDRFRQAFEMAAAWHAGQVRKGFGDPYILHPMAVAAIVGEHGGGEEELIAALLHDTVEDCGGMPVLERIRDEFGPRVAELVWGLTDSWEEPKPPWRARKEAFLARFATADLGTARIKLADKLHNLRSIGLMLRVKGPAAWSAFKGGRDGTIWWHERVLELAAHPELARLREDCHRALDAIRR
jgi:(p)ppGpp synthase/HD superfamily hydrolase